MKSNTINWIHVFRDREVSMNVVKLKLNQLLTNYILSQSVVKPKPKSKLLPPLNTTLYKDFQSGVVKTKPMKVIFPTNHKNKDNPMKQSKFEANTWSNEKRGKTFDSMPVTIGFNSTSNWIRKWREFSKPIAKPRNAK